MRTFYELVAFAAGFGVCWFSKDVISRVATGTEAFVKSLEDKAALLKAKL